MAEQLKTPVLPSMSDSLEELYRELGSSPMGLSGEEAVRRLATYGRNDTRPGARFALLREILQFFANPLVVILVLAAGVAGFTGDVPDAAIILAIVSLSIALNVLQTSRSRRAAEELQKTLAPTCFAIRDGKPSEVAHSCLVPGDVVRLDPGDVVPADCRLISGNNLHVQEAALTGESDSVAKFPSEAALESAAPGETDACVFMGTSVISGNAHALVVYTGGHTQFGKIASAIEKRHPETEFERGLRRFSVLILKTVVFLVLFVFLASIVRERDALQSLLFAVALAVGLTPEFLPMITTITLGAGAVRMSKKKVIVKNLAAIQNFGSIDILCSDKTGTLTTGVMELAKSVDAQGEESAEPLRLAAINSLLSMEVKSSLEAAILAKAGSIEESKNLGEIPFDFERRRSSVITEISGKRVLITKGAAESILPLCTSSTTMKIAEDLGVEGYRVLAVAWKEIGEKRRYSEEDETDLVLAGFLAFYDPPKEDASQAVRDLQIADVRIKILTGDSAEVTELVCRKVSIEPGRIVRGSDIEDLSEVALQRVAEETTVFARVTPDQKNRIIRALRNRGHVVGYLGDGINDAPSLHAADIGISVAEAVEVAREAADIILGEKSLRVLRDGILEGRRALGNVLKYILMGTSSNFGNMFSMAAASLFLPFLPMLPTQILLNNFLYDISQVTIPTDRVDTSLVSKPRRWDVRLIKNFMIWIGPISSIFDFITFAILLFVLHASDTLFRTGWFVESLSTQVLVILVIRTARNPLRSKPSKALFITICVVVLFGLWLPYSPISGLLGFVPLPLVFLALLAVMIVTYLALVEIVKRKLFSDAGMA